MNKRILAVSLWLFAGWYMGAMVASFVGLPELVGLLPGIAMAVFVGGDPLGCLWTRSNPSIEIRV